MVLGVSRGLIASVAAICAVLTLLVHTALPLRGISPLCPSDAPPSLEASDPWRWAAAAPGVNIYVAHHGGPQQNEVRVSAWVRLEFFRNAAGIDTNQVELWQFDCLEGKSRRLLRATEYRMPSGGERWMVSREVSDWRMKTSRTPARRVMRMVCELAASARQIEGREATERAPQTVSKSSMLSTAEWFNLVRDRYCDPDHKADTTR